MGQEQSNTGEGATQNKKKFIPPGMGLDNATHNFRSSPYASLTTEYKKDKRYGEIQLVDLGTEESCIFKKRLEYKTAKLFNQVS